MWRRKYNMEYGEKGTFSPWETCSDLYCGLLLVFVLLFFFAIYQYLDAKETNNADTAALQESMQEEQAAVLAIYKADLEEQEAAYQAKSEELESQQTVLAITLADLEEQEALIEEQRTQLALQQEELEEKQSELDSQLGLLTVQQAALEEQETTLSEQQATLEEQASQLTEQQATLEEQASQLAEQQATLEEQASQLSEQQSLLEAQAAQIEQVVGVRSQLISTLNEELTVNQIQVQADLATGAIVFESSILFDKNSNELSEEGKSFFREFLPVYLNVLLQPDYLDYIAEIIVEGHTDDSGTYLYNLQLSQERAYSVAEYFLGDDCDFLEADTISTLKKLVTVNGCADKDPVYQEDGTVDAEASRRVEIKFRLRDQEMIEELDQILNDQESAGGAEE